MTGLMKQLVEGDEALTSSTDASAKASRRLPATHTSRTPAARHLVLHEQQRSVCQLSHDGLVGLRWHPHLIASLGGVGSRALLASCPDLLYFLLCHPHHPYARPLLQP